MKNIFLCSLGALALNVVFAQTNDVQFHELPNFTNVNARAEIAFPDILGYKTLKGDMHIHTIFSDGGVLPEERVNEAWREGLDFISITDHNTPIKKHINGDFNTSYEMAKGTAAAKGITLIKGIEYTDEKPVGHLNFLFIDEANQYARTKIEPKEAIELAASKGAYITYNHPGWPDCNSDLFDFQIDFLKQGKIHAVEVFNGNEFYPQAIDYCKKYNIAPFSCTDIHSPINVNYDVTKVHRNLTLVFAKDNSVESIKEALFARRAVAYANNILAGKKEFLAEIMRNSLVTTSYKENNGTFSCLIKNNSDITYILEGASYERIVIPAHRTVSIGNNLKNLSFTYRVTNMFTGGGENLLIPLSFLLSKETKADMPYITKDLSFFDNSEPIEVFCTTPGAQIRYTLDGSEPSESSTLCNGTINMESAAMLKMKAFKGGMEPSLTYQRQAITSKMIAPENIKLKTNGVEYAYYEGAVISVNHIATQSKFIEKGVRPYFDLTVAKAEDFFGILFSGYVYIPTEGVYTFGTRSDDGSTFSISGVEVVDNDGSHGSQLKSAKVALKKGFHPYSLKYMEDYEGEALKLFWQLPSEKSLTEVPASALFIK